MLPNQYLKQEFNRTSPYKVSEYSQIKIYFLSEEIISRI